MLDVPVTCEGTAGSRVLETAGDTGCCDTAGLSDSAVAWEAVISCSPSPPWLDVGAVPAVDDSVCNAGSFCSAESVWLIWLLPDSTGMLISSLQETVRSISPPSRILKNILFIRSPHFVVFYVFP